MTTRMRRNGYRGEPTRNPLMALLPKQRLCLALVGDGKRCVQPRRHKGKCRSS